MLKAYRVPSHLTFGAPRRFMLLVVLFVVGTGILLLRWDTEQISVLAERGDIAALTALVQQDTARGTPNTDALAALGRLYEARKNPRRAVEMFERYALLRPKEIDVFRRLSRLYAELTDTEREVEALERLASAEPSLQNALALAQAYQKSQREPEARETLRLVEPLLTVENGGLLRLAELYVTAGATDAAARLLRRMEQMPVVSPSAHAERDRGRFLLARLLVDAGQSAEAAGLSKEWVRQWPEAWHAGVVLTIISTAGHSLDAIELAQIVVDKHPRLDLFFARELLKQRAWRVSHHILEGWHLRHLAPTSSEIAAFLSVCDELGDPAVVWQTIAAAIQGTAADHVLLRYAYAIRAKFGNDILVPFWNRLPRDFAARHPLLTAQMASHGQNRALAQLLTSALDVSKLDVEAQRAWLELLRTVYSQPQALYVLEVKRRRGELPAYLVREYALLAASRGS